MADLPDIDTDNVAFLSYWRATDHGVTSISPSDVTSWGRITTTTAYDNGLEGTYSPTSASASVHHWRVKNDGWIVTWIERGDNLRTSVSNDTSWAEGSWTTLAGWADPESNSGTLVQNSLERGINALYSNLSNSGSITYNTADVGLYNYAYPGATGATHFRIGGGDGTNKTASWQYTSSTSIEYVRVAGSLVLKGNIGGNVTFEGVDAVAASQGGYNTNYHYGAIDPVSRGILNSAGANQTLSVTIGSYNGSGITGNLLVLWS